MRIVAPRCQLLCCVFHGLDEDPGADAVDAYWVEAYSVFCKCRRPSERVVVFVDGNCRISLRDCDDDEIIGPLLDPPHRHNFVSEAFTCFCRKANLAVVSTFPDYVKDDLPTGTFHVRSGLLLRCDYLLVDSSAVVARKSLRVLHDFQMNNKKLDHLPICTVAIFKVKKALPIKRRRSAGYDREAVLGAVTSTDPGVIEKVVAFMLYLRAMPCIGLCVEPSSHSFLIDMYTLNGLRYFFRCRSR